MVGVDMQERTGLAADIDYAGSITGRPAFDFFNGSRTTLDVARVPVELVNARALADAPTLEREGIQIVRHATRMVLDWPIEQVRAVYLEEMCGFLREFTGADVVVPQGKRGLMIRRPPVEGRPHYLQMKGTRIAHLDFTSHSFDKWRDYAIDSSGIDAGPWSRVICMQTWRMMVPGPQNETLALMDARTYRREDGIVFDSIISTDDRDTFETVVIKHDPRHRWLFWPDLSPDEPILFKGWDTDTRYPSDVPHQAVTNPLAGPDPVLRESIECRFYCFYR